MTFKKALRLIIKTRKKTKKKMSNRRGVLTPQTVHAPGPTLFFTHPGRHSAQEASRGVEPLTPSYPRLQRQLSGV
jgi:hypothetical protein